MANKTISSHIPVHLALLSLPLAVVIGCSANGDINQQTTVEPEATAQLSYSGTQTPTQEPVAAKDADENPGQVTTEQMIADAEIPEMEKFPLNQQESVQQPEQLIISFAFDKTEVDATSEALLRKHAQYLQQNPELILNVSGHTDKWGPQSYNKKLSKQRAEAVANLLISFGAPAEQIAINGYGDSMPLASALHSRENRRVELEYTDLHLVSSQP